MVFLGYEKPVEQGREQVFDPVTAQMVLNANRDYINAVYNEYQQAKQDMKDFNKEYGDFLSPIQKDMDWYTKNVTGAVRDKINDLYARGIDPLRSSEGRAAISMFLNSIDTAGIAKVRQSAEAAKEYIKNRGILEASGKWDPNFERFANNGQMLEDWDTMGGGQIWTRTSPAELKTLKEVTEPWYNNRTAHALDKAGVESFGMTYDPRYQYMGFTDNDLLDIAAGQTPGWNGSIYADYYRDVAKKMVAANKLLNGDNSPVTAEEVEKQLQRNVATANKEYLIQPTKEADQFALDNHRTANDIRAAGEKAAIEFAYDKKRLTDPVFVAAARQRSGSGKGGKVVEDHNIFREAEIKANSALPNNPWTTNVGTHTGYVPSGQYGELIDPIIPGQYLLGKDKNSGQTIEMFKFNNDDILDHIYTVEKNGELRKRELVNNSNSDVFIFTPEGQIVATKTPNGYRYFISGTLKGNKSGGNVYSKKNKQIWIEVTERGYVYDGK